MQVSQDTFLKGTRTSVCPFPARTHRGLAAPTFPRSDRCAWGIRFKLTSVTHCFCQRQVTTRGLWDGDSQCISRSCLIDSPASPNTLV